MKDEKGEIDLRYFDEAGWGMIACIPYSWQEKAEPVVLKDVEGKRISVIGIMNVENECIMSNTEKY